MIVADTSVWIGHLNGRTTPKVTLLRGLLGHQPILVGDLILCEILQGLRREREARLVETAFRRFDIAPMCGAAIARRAAGHYRQLRARGITIRKTIDLIIGSFCIENGHALLHDDRDFDPMERLLGLQVV